MGRLGFCLSVGVLLMILGGFPLFLVYGVASMVRRDLEGWDYWTTVLSRMFNLSNDAWCFSLQGSVIFLFGAGLCVYGLLSAVVSGTRQQKRAD